MSIGSTPDSPQKLEPTPTSYILHARCDDPKCNCKSDPILFLNQRCHLGAATETFVDQSDGTITVICHACQKPVVTFRLQRD